MRFCLVPFALSPIIFGMLASVCFAQFGAPELQALPQLGCKAGQVPPAIGTAIGQALAGTVSDWTIPGFNAESIPADTVPVPADTAPGIYQLQALGPNGLSNSRSFMVTTEPWVVVTGNESEVNPTAIAPGTIWQDDCPERGRNYYRLKCEQDQKLELKSIAYALDSRARLVLSLLNPDHVTIATCSATNDSDASMLVELKANTEYVLAVHDHLFRGGSDYRYVLKLDNPSSPDLDQAGFVERWRRFAKAPRNVDCQPVDFASLWHPRCGMLRSPTNAPTVIHDEALHSGAKSMMVTWPVIVAGDWNTNDDIDMIDFECDAKTDVSVEMVSQRMGELSDGLVVAYRVENPGQPNEVLHRLVENDDGPAVGNGEMRFAIKDPMFTFQTTEKGTYRLHVRSQQRLDRLAKIPMYAIEIRKPNPGFALCAHLATPTLTPDQARTTSPTLVAGGSVMFSIHAIRFDNFAEPIELSIVGLPDGCRGGTGVMARDQNLATLNVWNLAPPPASQERKDISRLEVKGSVEVGALSISAVAVPLEVTWNATDTFRSPIAKMARYLKLSKADSVVCPLTIELGPKDLDAKSPIRMDVIRGQSLKIPVRVTRRTGGEGVITVRLHHSQTKTTAAEIKIEPNASEGVLDLQIPKDTPIGEFLFGALCESAVSVPNTDPAAKDKTKSITLQLPSSNIRVRIGDAP